MYARDFPRKNGANNAIGPGEQVESLCRRHQGRFGNKASRSDQVRGVRVLETTEWSDPLVQYSSEPCVGVIML